MRFSQLLKAISVVVLGVVIMSANVVYAGTVRMRNCLAKRVFVCVYNNDDKLLWVPAESKGIKPGERKKFDCLTKRCKTFIGISKKHAPNLIQEAHIAGAVGVGIGAGVAAGASGAIALSGSAAMVALYGGTAATTGTMLAVGAGAVGVAVAAGAAAYGLVEAGEGIAVAVMCKKIIKKGRKLKLKKSMKGRYALKAGMVDDTPYLYIDKENSSCDEENTSSE